MCIIFNNEYTYIKEYVKGVYLKSLKKSWLDTTTAHGKMLFTIFAGIAQFERDLTSERTKEGILAARKRGKLSGRPKADEEKVQYALNRG